MKHLFFSILISFTVIGCNSLPQGTPPKGNIVTLPEFNTEIYTPSFAINYMLLMLQTECPIIANAPIPPVMEPSFQNTGNKKITFLEKSLWYKLRKSKMIIQGGNFFSITGTYILVSRLKSLQTEQNKKNIPVHLFRWTISIKRKRGNSVLWSKSVIVKLTESSGT